MAKRKIVKKKNSAQTAFSRFLFIVAIFTIWIFGIGVRLVHLQVNQSDELRKKAVKQRSNTFHDRVLRGSILDRSERALAISLKVKSLFADPTKIADIEQTSKKVAEVLAEKPSEILSLIRKAKNANRQFVWLARKLDEEKVKKIDELHIAGLGWQEEQKRSYPHGILASNVVGFANSEEVGQAGIELSQEKFLRGEVVKGIQKRTRDGRVFDREETEETVQPKDIVLTLDYSIQYKTEKALAKGVQNARAKSGTAVVLDPKTGEILAMASVPTFDPNKFGEVAAENLSNKAIQNFYTPGSTFKLITYGGSLEEGLIKPEGKIDCSKGFIEVAGRPIKDSHKIGTVSYAEALAVSSNVAAVRTGLSLGKEKFYDYAKKFGFGAVTGVELPAETGGILHPLDDWNPDSLASVSLGYEIGVTTLQTASAFATIANEGIRVKPHIVKQIKDSSGNIFDQTESEKVQVVSPAAARDMRKMLQKVVVSGTGVKAQVSGYSVAGKTGTAWKYDDKLKKINENKYVSSFVGFAPADNPSVVIVVVLDEPRGEYRDGGHVSAPIFREIAEQILPELGIKPDGIERVIPDEIIAEDNKKHTVERVESAAKNIVSSSSSKSDSRDRISKSDFKKREALIAKPSEKTAEKNLPKSKDTEQKLTDRPRVIDTKKNKNGETKSEKHKT
jgi:cell division protein FtsI/penicillin-binding protein 2